VRATRATRSSDDQEKAEVEKFKQLVGTLKGSLAPRG
jgi:hypothetical protein